MSPWEEYPARACSATLSRYVPLQVTLLHAWREFLERGAQWVLCGFAASATEVKCEGSGDAPQSARRMGPRREFPGVAMPLTPTVAPPCMPPQESLESCRSADSRCRVWPWPIFMRPRQGVLFQTAGPVSCDPGRASCFRQLRELAGLGLRERAGRTMALASMYGVLAQQMPSEVRKRG